VSNSSTAGLPPSAACIPSRHWLRVAHQHNITKLGELDDDDDLEKPEAACRLEDELDEAEFDEALDEAELEELEELEEDEDEAKRLERLQTRNGPLGVGTRPFGSHQGTPPAEAIPPSEPRPSI